VRSWGDLPSAQANPTSKVADTANIDLVGQNDQVLIQERLIARVVELCRADERFDAVLQYGSFVQGSGDEHSDIEFWLFSRADIDAARWCARIAPITHHVRNEFGADVVFFEGLARGEFHFASDIAQVAEWPARGADVDRMIVVDRTGALRTALETVPSAPALPDAEEVCGRFANWLVLAHHVAARGEALRTADALWHVHRHLLWMARLVESSTEHWLTPSRLAEQELSASIRSRIDATSPAAAWRSGRALWLELGCPVPAALFAELDAALS
jgi:lincosamide nucleotidyltransferase